MQQSLPKFGKGIQWDTQQGKPPTPSGMAASSSSMNVGGLQLQPPASAYASMGVSVPMGPHRSRPFPCVTMMTDEQVHNLLYGILLHRPHVATEWAHGVAHARPGIWIPQVMGGAISG